MLYEILSAAITFAAGFFLCFLWMLRRVKRTASLKHNTEMWNVFSDAMPIHVFIKNADDAFRYVYSNKTRNDCFGLTAEQILGNDDMVLLSPEGARKQLAIDAEILKKPQGIHEGAVEFTDRDGRKRYFRIAQTPYREETGRTLLLGAALDVTELEESRRQLAEVKKHIEERELWLSRTLKSIGDAVIVTDRKGITVLLNPVAERLLGIESKDAVGKPHDDFFRIVGATDSEPRLSPVGRALRTGAIVELANNTDLVSADGSRYHISDSAAPILDDERNVLGAVLVFRDVTETYQRRAALRDAVNDWEMASAVSGIASFRMNFRTRRITGSRRLPEFWPIADGKAVPAEEYVLPEDVSAGRGLLAAVMNGNETHMDCKYRVRKDGKIRHYRIYAAKDPERPEEVAGIVQDMTEMYENERRLRNTRIMWSNLIDALPLNFFAKNANDSFRYTICNKRFAGFLGKKPEEIIGKQDAELFRNAGDLEQFASRDRAIVESGKACNFTESVYGSGKRPLQFQTIKMPCEGPNGERLLLGVSIDVTELVTLSKSQKVLRQGLEMLVEETDVNEGIAKALKSVCEYIGVTRSFILHFDTEKQTVFCVREYCDQGKKKLLDGLQNVPFSTGVNWPEHFKNECFLNFPDLQNEATLSLLGPFYANMIKAGDFRSLYTHRLIIDGKFWGYAGFAYERKIRILDKQELDFIQSAARFIELMIRHKRTQTELRDAVAQANAAEKAKSRFLATMSHEIRTPLNAVIGFSELLKDGTLSGPEQKDYLNDISIAGNALLAIINDILDLSKLEAGKMQFAKTATDFSALVHEIMIVFRQKFRDKHLEERLDVKDIPCIKIDPLRIRQILFNLVGNAVKFTDRGFVAVSASFSPDADSNTGTFRFSVRDTGCGISEEDGKRLFQPFVQSNAMTGTHKAGLGTGLGLLLVRRMLEYMNGEIRLQSKPGEGAEFTVTLHRIEYLPVKTDIPRADVPEEPFQPLRTSCRMLLVDDVPMNLKVLQAMLRKLGQETVLAENGADALAILEREKIDLVLTDLWMPGMTGVELADRIHRSGKYPDIRIAAVSADTGAGNSFDPQTFDAILSKPISMEKLRPFLAGFGSRPAGSIANDETNETGAGVSVP